MKNLTRTWMLMVPAVAVTSFGVGLAASGVAPTLTPETTTTAPPPTEAIAAAESLSSAFEFVADTLGPAVVTIRSTKEVDVPARMRPFPPGMRNSPFEEFFGEDFFDRFNTPLQPGQKQFQRGEGSGVIVRPDGYILTNSHVVNDADEVTVILSDDRRYTAEVVGTDPKTDIAVIRIDSDGLAAAPLGNSDDLHVGQWVVAAGNPFGLSSSITAGIVSATGRSRVGITDYEDFIQTDAAINRGNSGGPLVNLRGEVVGINTAILSRTGGNIGIGFAIPINMARNVMEELIEDGRVTRGYLGVLIQDLSEGMAKSFGYDGTSGALISDVTDDGPASSAGLRPGDIIVEFDGEPVTNIAALRFRVADVDPGETVDVVAFRDGRRETFDVTIDELPTQVASLPSSEGETIELGMNLDTLTPDVAQRFRLDADLEGVVVTSIQPMGPASRAGLQPGDVITHVQDTSVRNVREFRDAMRDVDLAEGVRLTVQDRVRKHFVFLQMR